MNNLLKINAGRAGVSKRVWAHGVRHSAATRDAANGWNEAKLRIKFGWSGKSSMPSVYAHLANSDLKDTVLEENGIVERKEKREKPLLENAVKCLFCFSVNLKESDYCAKCGKPLNTEQLKKLEHQARVTGLIQEMLKKELEKNGFDMAEFAKALATKG